jgi:pimeloyl-ACP methyl ester carboxylesterase/predicted glycosyltransferase
MRARRPDRSAHITRAGLRVAFDVYGEGNPLTVLLLPAWSIAHGLLWKFQVAALANRYRVVTIDGRGNGRSDRPADPAAYMVAEYVADAVAVLDEIDCERAVVVGLSMGAARAAAMAADHPDRVLGAVLIASALNFLTPPHAERSVYSFTDELDTDEGWAIFNEHAWRRDFAKFARFFWGQIYPEPHSTKAIEDGVGWMLETDAETLIATAYAPLDPASHDEAVAQLRRITCPTLVIHGTDDAITPVARGVAAAGITGGDLLLIEGGGHCPHARDPVRVNRALTEFIDRVTPPAQRPATRTTWTRARSRPKRVLYLSSPIGLGHARRDLAIVRALRAAAPGVQVDWLAQDPVTTFLRGTGETVHPAAAHLVSESAHLHSEAHEHDLHAFQALRRMDEILLANFTVFQAVVDTGDYDLVVGDEAWDVDYFWHENPELKRAAYAWMTDFVGWLPMPDGGAAEAALTADYNAEMLEHIARLGRVRDRSIFVGDADDIVPGDFGPGLPTIRDWTEQHYDFAGYITGFDPPDRAAVRRRLGYPDDAKVVIVTVGGSGVGEALLRKVIDAYPHARKECDELRLVVVAGPRIDPCSLPARDGVDVRGFVPDLELHLAACDAAIVQGGLTTAMELVAARRPFLYFPLAHHFEQQLHVRHRLERHRAGRYMDFATTDAADIAAVLLEHMQERCDYLPVSSDGAIRAAGLLAELL